VTWLSSGVARMTVMLCIYSNPQQFKFQSSHQVSYVWRGPDLSCTHWAFSAPLTMVCDHPVSTGGGDGGEPQNGGGDVWRQRRITLTIKLQTVTVNMRHVYGSSRWPVGQYLSKQSLFNSRRKLITVVHSALPTWWSLDAPYIEPR